MVKNFIFRNLILQLIVFIFASFFIFEPVKAFGQTNGNSVPDIKRSTDKVLINGKVYFVHIVKKSETLYSIAKAYNVTVNDITTANPSSVVEIKIDQVLRIPEASGRSNEVEVKKTEGQVLHVVAPKQTLYSISRIYGVKVSEIEELNPEVKYDSLQINQVIKIPLQHKTENTETVKERKSDSIINYISHLVEAKETVYSLSKQYNVSQDAIIQANSEVAKDGLKIGQNIRIPVVSYTEPIKSTQVTDSFNVVKKEHVETAILANCDSFSGERNPTQNIKIALLLPFFASGTSVSDAETIEDIQNEDKGIQKQGDEFNPIAVNYIELYQGILLALNELKAKGLNITLNVYDTEKDTKKIKDILAKPDFQQCNLIIGPIFNEQAKIVSEYAKNKGIIEILPTTHSREITENNPHIFQINPGKKLQIESDMAFIKQNISKNIIIAYNSTATKSDEYNDFKKELKDCLKEKAEKIKEVSVFDNDFIGMQLALDSLKDNIVLSPVDDLIFVTNMLGSLESKLVYNQITVLGMQEWTNYNRVDLNYMYDLQLTYNTPFFIDYESEATKNYLLSYRNYFGIEPVKSSKYGFNYSLLGYNLANYFITGFAKYGNSLPDFAHCIQPKVVNYPFEFKKISNEGGYINTFQQQIKYNKDYTIDRTNLKSL